MRQSILKLLERYDYDAVTVSDTLERLDHSSDELLARRYEYLRQLVVTNQIQVKPFPVVSTPSGQMKFLI